MSLLGEALSALRGRRREDTAATAAPAKALDALRGFETGWGGTAQQRLAKKYAVYAAAAGIEAAPLPHSEADIFARVDAEARLQANRTEQQGARTFEPRPEANPVSTGAIPGAGPGADPIPPPGEEPR